MTAEERMCFQYGRTAASHGTANAPCYDINMTHMTSEARSERGNERNVRNLAAWHWGYLYQMELDGQLLDKNIFKSRFVSLFSTEDYDGLVEKWADFAEENEASGQYVDFRKGTDKDVDMSRWYDTLIAGFFKINVEYGNAVAKKVFELADGAACLYPYEMERAAESIRNGGGPQEIVKAIEYGTLSNDVRPFFPKMRDVLQVYESAQKPNHARKHSRRTSKPIRDR